MTANARIGDPISCGDIIGQGSGDCFMNGLPVARVGDLTVGHCYPPTPLLVGAPTVFFNNKLAAIVGNAIVSHTCDDDTHGGSIAVGSPNCFSLDSGASVVSGVDNVQLYVQSTVPISFASEQLDDDEGSDPVYVTFRQQSTNDYVSPQRSIVETIQPTIKKTVPVLTSCDDIYAAMGIFNGLFQLSTNFTLAQLTTNTLVSNYALRAQGGLSAADIVCNLRHLCINVLEPLLALYGSDLVINSGFRHGTGTSQHYKGQAVDVSFRNIRRPNDAFERAQLLPSQVPFDQYIFEQNLSVWYHFSYDATGNRSQVLTKPRGTQYYAGVVRLAA